MRPLHLRTLWILIGLALIAALAAGSLWPTLPMPMPPFSWSDKFMHFIAYFLIATWFAALVKPHKLWLLGIALVVLGAGLEGAQWLGGQRHAEWADGIANTLGVVSGLLLSLWFTGGMLQRLESYWFEHRHIQAGGERR